jgi:hypothetical protein
MFIRLVAHVSFGRCFLRAGVTCEDAMPLCGSFQCNSSWKILDGVGLVRADFIGSIACGVTLLAPRYGAEKMASKSTSIPRTLLWSDWRESPVLRLSPDQTRQRAKRN